MNSADRAPRRETGNVAGIRTEADETPEPRRPGVLQIVLQSRRFIASGCHAEAIERLVEASAQAFDIRLLTRPQRKKSWIRVAPPASTTARQPRLGQTSM